MWPGYEVARALAAATAGVAIAGLSFSIFMLQGGVLPTVQPARAFSSAIPVELLLVPIGLGIGWLEFGRFRLLRASMTEVMRLTRLAVNRKL